MSELTPETRRILALLDALDEAERERDDLYARAKDAEHDNAGLREARDEAREALARVEQYADEIERTTAECERLAGVRADLSDAGDLRTAAIVNRKRAEGIRAALRGPSDTEGQA